MSNSGNGQPAKKGPSGKILARREARTLAMQALYSWHIAGQPLNEIEAQFRVENDFSKVDGAYFHEILHGVQAFEAVVKSSKEGRPVKVG